MKALATALAVFLTLGLAAVDAEAKRMGGGRSMGMQRSTQGKPVTTTKERLVKRRWHSLSCAVQNKVQRWQK